MNAQTLDNQFRTIALQARMHQQAQRSRLIIAQQPATPKHKSNVTNTLVMFLQGFRRKSAFDQSPVTR